MWNGPSQMVRWAFNARYGIAIYTSFPSWFQAQWLAITCKQDDENWTDIPLVLLWSGLDYVAYLSPFKRQWFYLRLSTGPRIKTNLMLPCMQQPGKGILSLGIQPDKGMSLGIQQCWNLATDLERLPPPPPTLEEKEEGRGRGNISHKIAIIRWKLPNVIFSLLFFLDWKKWSCWKN